MSRRDPIGSVGKSPPRGRRRVDPPRDQEPSTFTRILEALLLRVPGSVAAALVDSEGETVDYAGFLDTFELKIAAAHWQIAMREIREAGPIGSSVGQVVVRARVRSFVVRPIHQAYTLVVVMHPRAAFSVSERALQEAQRDLCVEAGFAVPRAPRWYAVDVLTSARDRRRPDFVQIGPRWEPVEVMGAVVGLPPRERGFRVRLPTGIELLLVRERTGRWWADEHLAQA